MCSAYNGPIILDKKNQNMLPQNYSQTSASEDGSPSLTLANYVSFLVCTVLVSMPPHPILHGKPSYQPVLKFPELQGFELHKPCCFGMQSSHCIKYAQEGLWNMSCRGADKFYRHKTHSHILQTSSQSG